MRKRKQSIAEQLAEFGVDASQVAPVFREELLAELKQEQLEREERARLDQEQRDRRKLQLIKQASPAVGGLLESLMEL